MRSCPPTDEEWSQLKAKEEAKREAYLRRKFTPAQLWEQQQKALDALAKLRPDRAVERTQPGGKREPDSLHH
jgi:hypothetical protein